MATLCSSQGIEQQTQTSRIQWLAIKMEKTLRAPPALVMTYLWPYNGPDTKPQIRHNFLCNIFSLYALMTVQFMI